MSCYNGKLMTNGILVQVELIEMGVSDYSYILASISLQPIPGGPYAILDSMDEHAEELSEDPQLGLEQIQRFIDTWQANAEENNCEFKVSKDVQEFIDELLEEAKSPSA